MPTTKTPNTTRPETIHAVWQFLRGIVVGQAFRLPTYTEATVPDGTDPTLEGQLIYVSDGTSGTDRIRYHDGAGWVNLG